MTNKHEIITNDAEKIAKIPIGTYFIYESQGIGMALWHIHKKVEHGCSIGVSHTSYRVLEECIKECNRLKEERTCENYVPKN